MRLNWFQKMIRTRAPVSLKGAFKRLARRLTSAQPFSGRYARISDVPTINEGYDNKSFLAENLESALEKLKESRTGAFLPDATIENPIRNLLPLLVAARLRDRGRVTVLDFGGGLGVSYIDRLSFLPQDADIRFHVVDTKATCDAARDLFAGDARIAFHASLPDGIGDVDIVHLGTSLEYVEDYRKVIADLAALAPLYVFVVDTFMCRCPTFATQQVNMIGKGIPYWIFDYNEVIRLFAGLGYNLVYKSSNYQPYHDLSNFPAECGMRDSFNLLFSRKG